MNYEAALEFINGIAKFGTHLGLENITTLMEYLGNPQNDLRYIHVAGTNGKGSTVAFISQILIESGMKVGIYTSPFIQRFSERIKINDREISDDELARVATTVRKAAEKMVADGHDMPSEFELVNAMAFIYFKENKCDICVLEVGMGGRLDATNVIRCPLLAVITTISFDHMDYLGDTLAKIAYEKAGIIKNGGDVLLYPQEKEAEDVFENVCSERHAVLHHAGMPKKLISADTRGQIFDMDDYKGLRISLLGNYQINNAATAVNAALILRKKGLKISDDNIKKGLEHTIWPGRFEIISRNPDVIIDGSHNAEGMQKLSESLHQYFHDRKIIFIFGILRDKQYGKMLDIILPSAKRAYTVTPPTPRALPAEELMEEIEKRSGIQTEAFENVETALKEAQEAADSDDIICVCGSLYYIGQVRSILFCDKLKK